MLEAGTGINFAPGTTAESKNLVARLFTPEGLLDAYRAARGRLGTGDLVLRASELDAAGFEVETRSAYVRRTRELFGKIPALMRGIAERPAHSVVKLPFEGEAFWLIVHRGPKDVPIMCVIFGTPYKLEAN